MTEFINSPWAFLACAAWVIAGAVVDYRSSSVFMWYGGNEANKFFQDRYGFFDKQKYIVTWSAVLAAVGFVCLVYYPPAAVVLLIPGAMLFVVGILNSRDNRKKRLEQIAWLRNVQAKLDAGDEEGAFYVAMPRQMVTIYDRSFYPLFAWLYVEHPTDKPDQDQIYYAAERCTRNIVNTARRPEAEWFPR